MRWGGEQSRHDGRSRVWRVSLPTLSSPASMRACASPGPAHCLEAACTVVALVYVTPRSTSSHRKRLTVVVVVLWGSVSAPRCLLVIQHCCSVTYSSHTMACMSSMPCTMSAIDTGEPILRAALDVMVSSLPCCVKSRCERMCQCVLVEQGAQP